MDDHFFPYRSTESVRKVVHLIENHVTQRFKRHGVFVQHVAQHFGGHDHDIGLGIDGRISGKQTHPILPILIHQIMVFLVAQRFDRRGVERLDITFLRQIDGEIGNDGLARTRRGGNQHIAVGFQRLIGFHLEIVKLEWHGLRKSRSGHTLLALGLLEHGVAL